VREEQRALRLLERLAALREGIAVGYVPLTAAQTDVRKLTVTESHPLMLPEAAWGRIKVGARTPPMREGCSPSSMALMNSNIRAAQR
jgi:hypothetical protein